MQQKIISCSNQPTPRQLELLKAISNFRVRQCYSPTMAELAGRLGISRSTIFEHIAKLQRKGLLSTFPGKARSLQITSKGQKLLSRAGENHPAAVSAQPTGIPLAGRIAAGLPIEAIEDTQHFSLRCHFGTTDDVFALEVKGDSMIDDGIFNGDYAICRKAIVANNGQLVVAIVNQQEATLKRFYKGKKQVRLQPANKDYRPIYTDDCRIEAVVVGLVRKL